MLKKLQKIKGEDEKIRYQNVCLTVKFVYKNMKEERATMELVRDPDHNIQSDEMWFIYNLHFQKVFTPKSYMYEKVQA